MGIWEEINMYKLRDYRDFYIESMITSPSMGKLHFLQGLKRWFDQRSKHSAQTYNPLARRAEILAEYRRTGRFVKFQAWVKNDPEAIQAASSPRIPEMKAVVGNLDAMQSDGAVAKSVVMPSDNR